MNPVHIFTPCLLPEILKWRHSESTFISLIVLAANQVSSVGVFDLYFGHSYFESSSLSSSISFCFCLWCVSKQNCLLFLLYSTSLCLYQLTYQVTFFWDVMSCILIDCYQRFGRTCCLHLQSRRACHEDGSSMFHWTCVMICQAIWHHIPEESIFIVRTVRTSNFRCPKGHVQFLYTSHPKHSDETCLSSFSLYHLCP
jgi:hypothetical protein